MKTPVICTTLLVEHSPQALPLGAACIASDLKHDSRTADICTVGLIAFDPEDKTYLANSATPQAAATYIARELQFYAKQLTSSADEQKAAIFTFSVFVWNRPVLEAAARILRSQGHICIAGGPEVTAAPDSFTDFDAVITGAGEGKVPGVIAEFISRKSSDNAGTRKSSAPHQLANGPAFASSESSAANSQPANSPYLDHTLDATKYGGVLWELARGCPFKCSYCYESKGEKTIRRFPMERIKAELDLFAKQKIPQVFVLDPTYNANKKQALELLDLIAKKTPDTFYYFEARAEFIDHQLAQAFTKIPCALQIGLQSGSEAVLQLVNRPFNRKQFLKGIGCLNDAGVTFGLDLIYGLPGETFKSFKQGIDFAVSVYPNNLEIFCLSVLPGTDLSDRAADLKLTYEPKPPYHIIHTSTFSEAELAQSAKLAQACTWFYNEGRAVPWFNTICHTLHARPSVLFEEFHKFATKAKIDLSSCPDHAAIEKVQIDFITAQFRQKHQDRFIKLASDVIRINGAISRTQDTGKSEKITLSYPAEYLDSQYATDFQFFLTNIKPRQNTITTFKKNNATYWN